MKHFRFFAVSLLVWFGAISLRAQTTSFTYQGRLTVGGVVTNGSYDLKFSLFTTNTGGAQVGSALTNAQTSVSNGMFTVSLNFGSNIFTGASYWLEIGVRPGGSNTFAFTPLAPRQPIAPTPYALYAANAGSVNGGTLVASNATTLGGTIQFAGNSAAPGYVWTATDTNGSGQWLATPTPSPFNPTNVVFYSTNSDDLTGPGWQIVPTNISSGWTNGGVKWFAMTAPISNAALGHFGEYRAVSSIQPNSYGDPLGDLTYTFGFNFGGSETGHSSFGPTATNMPNWSKTMETSFQNYAGLTAMEDWWTWGAPYTQWGTNAQWRYFGGDLFWDSATKQYLDSDFTISVDHFYLGGAFNRSARNGAFGFQVNDLGNGGKDVKVYGTITTYTNASNSGGLALKGGRFDMENATETANCAFYFNSGTQEFLLHGADSAPPGVGYRVFAFSYNRFEARYPTNVPLEVMGAYNGQTTNLFEAKANPSGAVLAAIDNWGNGRFANFRAGITNLDNTATALTVKFSTSFATTNYTVTITPEFNLGTAWWVSDKATNCFRLNLGAASSGGNFSWQAMLPQ
ncbi:MAG: hypothetical protein RLZZ350_2459 [Verrucomicrobiota bacterium]|jgi:hypothetical protein